jgi:hypothetical protein
MRDRARPFEGEKGHDARASYIQSSVPVNILYIELLQNLLEERVLSNSRKRLRFFY